MGNGRGCVGSGGQGGCRRRSRHDQSEERHRVLHLWRKGPDGGCVVLGLSFQEKRRRVTPGATRYPGPGAKPECSDACALVSAPRSSWAGSSRAAAAHPGKSGGNQVLRISPRVTRLESARPFPGGDGASKPPATVVTFGTTGLTDPTLLCRTSLTGDTIPPAIESPRSGNVLTPGTATEEPIVHRGWPRTVRTGL